MRWARSLKKNHCDGPKCFVCQVVGFFFTFSSYTIYVIQWVFLHINLSSLPLSLLARLCAAVCAFPPFPLPPSPHCPPHWCPSPLDSTQTSHTKLQFYLLSYRRGHRTSLCRDHQLSAAVVQPYYWSPLVIRGGNRILFWTGIVRNWRRGPLPRHSNHGNCNIANILHRQPRRGWIPPPAPRSLAPSLLATSSILPAPAHIIWLLRNLLRLFLLQPFSHSGAVVWDTVAFVQRGLVLWFRSRVFEVWRHFCNTPYFISSKVDLRKTVHV